MENTQENKERFFAQYWGVEVVKYNGAKLIKVDFVDFIDMKNNICLELKPLSSITDDDYRFIVQNKVMNPGHPSDDEEFGERIGDIHLSDIMTADYLRSKGYALPWMGLSVEEMIDFGWIKLK